MNGTAQHALPDQAAEQVRRGFRSGLMSLIKSPRGIQSLVVVADIVALVLSFWVFVLFWVNSGLFSNASGFPTWVVLQTTLFVIIFWMGLFWFTGVYVSIHNRSLFEEYYAVLKIILIGFAIIFVALFSAYANISDDARSNRLITLLTYFCLVAGMVAMGRYLVRGVVRRLRKRGIGLRRTIIVGESQNGQQLLEMLTRDLSLGYEVVGTVVTRSDATSDFTRLSLGTLEQIDAIISSKRIEVTVLAMERDRDLVPRLMTETSVADTTIKIIPSLYDLVSGQTRAQHLYGVPLIEINPQIMPAWQQHVKRGLDICYAASIIIIGLPLWILVALLIKIEDRGPIFYSQERMGLLGRRFMMHKFRSMGVDAERKGISWTAVNDPRVTRVGRIIRQLHIDEIPQFWNVLVGEMSIVGPRPERPFYVEKFTQMLPSYPRRLRVKPGVTGWNQVHMAEVVETIEFLQERLRHDFFYIENVSLRLDIEIIFRTIIRVLQRKGQA